MTKILLLLFAPLIVICLPLVGYGVLQAFGVVRGVPVHYNLRNLIVRWPITLLTALAFTLVVGLMTVMLAFVNGMYKLTEGSGRPENVMVMADGATDELFSNLGFGSIREIELRNGVVRNEDGKPMASWEVYCVVNQPIPTRKCPKCGAIVKVKEITNELVEHGDPTCPGSGQEIKGSRGRRFISVRGIDDPVISGAVHGLPLADGEWFSTSGLQTVEIAGRKQTVIEGVVGAGLARELGSDQGKRSLEIGDLFELGPRTWVVAGIMNSAGSTYDSEVWVKRTYAAEMFGKATYTTVVLRTADGAAAKSLVADLNLNFKDPAVGAQTEPEYFDKLNTTNQQFLISILVVVAIMAVGGVFGVMNTMFAAISQRTKDIGVLRLLGFTRWQILVSFFVESLLLALIGGAVGCALGFLANGYSATSIVSSGPGGGGKSVVLQLIVDARIIGGGLLFSLFMGAIGGLLPALSAMRLKPLESLR